MASPPIGRLETGLDIPIRMLTRWISGWIREAIVGRIVVTTTDSSYLHRSDRRGDVAEAVGKFYVVDLWASSHEESRLCAEVYRTSHSRDFASSCEICIL